MERVLILGLALLLCATAEELEALLQEPLRIEKVQPTDEPYLIETNQISKIRFDQDLCSSTLQHDGVNIFCPRTSNPFCYCDGNRCSCCFTTKLNLLNIDNSLCVDLTYNSFEKSMRLGLKWNNIRIISTGFPFVRPTEEPKCIGLNIIGTNVCVHFKDMSIIGGRPNFCASLAIHLFRKTVFVFNIGCFEYVQNALGSDLRDVGFLLPADSYTRNITVVADKAKSKL